MQAVDVFSEAIPSFSLKGWQKKIL